MPHSIQITIPQPCQAPWANMQVSDSGRHCAQCRKTVVDFTTMSDLQLWQALNAVPAGLCGRFTASQLGRDLAPPARPVTGLRHWVAGLMVVGILQAGAMPVAPVTPNSSFALSDYRAVSQTHCNRENLCLPQDSVLLRGRVLNKRNKRPIPNASIRMKGERFHVTTDVTGEFSISLPEFVARRKPALIIDIEGFTPREIASQFDSTIVIYLKKSTSKQQVVVVGTPRFLVSDPEK